MNVLENSVNYKCARITECDSSLIATFRFNEDKDAGSLEYYLKSPDGAWLEEMSGIGRTYVVIDTALNFIVGYFTLRAGQCHLNPTRFFSSTKVIEPGIELAMFAVNDAYKSFFDNLTFSFGEWIFTQYVLPKAKEAAELIGIKLIYIFALPSKPRLTEFYKRLGFVNPRYASDNKRRIRTIIPVFDRGCVFMFRSL